MAVVVIFLFMPRVVMVVAAQVLVAVLVIMAGARSVVM